MPAIYQYQLRLFFSELNKFNKQNYYNIQREQKKEKPKIEKKITSVNPAIAKAEEVLLELAINFETVGTRLEEELPHEMISETPMGQALNIAISQAMHGEWENIISELNIYQNDSPSSNLSQMLANPTKYKKNFDSDKAVADCIKTIKFVKISEEILSLMRELRTITDSDKKNEISRVILNLQKEKIQLKNI